MILKNVELEWAKLVKSAPDMGFDGNSPQWQVTAVTRDKKVSAEWKAAGMNIKIGEDDGGVKYSVALKKPAVNKKTGAEEKPVPVVGPDLHPLDDVSVIGNGTTANVRVRTFEYNYNGRSGTGFRLDGIQVVNLVEFKGAANDATAGFEVIEQANDKSADEEDLY